LSAIRFYLDEHIWLAVSDALRTKGIDCLSTSARGRRGASDSENLAWCLASKRVIVTSDADYPRLHASGEPHAGIAFVPRGKFSLGGLIERLTQLSADFTLEEMAGRLEYL
jgi:Domain of unknown function (DUF5615)